VQQHRVPLAAVQMCSQPCPGVHLARQR
jgi:hypothetical protein